MWYIQGLALCLHFPFTGLIMGARHGASGGLLGFATGVKRPDRVC